MKRSAVITGGTGEIGFAIAEKLLLEGYLVSVLGSSQKSLEKFEWARLKYKDDLSFWVCDLRDLQSTKNVLDGIYKKVGSIDALVNCAGKLETTQPEELSEEVWDEVIDINLKSYFFTTQFCLPYLKQSKIPRVVNVSSNAGRMGGYANGAAYAASKGAVISLTYNLARKLAKYGITVNCVAPGTIETKMIEAIPEEKRINLVGRFPLGRFGHTEEVAEAVKYFLSDGSAFTTGATLDVNGGLFMG